MPPQGTGTELDPLIIDSAADYEYAVMSYTTNYGTAHKHMEQSADITFTQNYYNHAGLTSEANEMWGIYDGKGYKLIDLTVGTSTNPFAVTGPYGKHRAITQFHGTASTVTGMKNVQFENISVYRETNDSGNYYSDGVLFQWANIYESGDLRNYGILEACSFLNSTIQHNGHFDVPGIFGENMSGVGTQSDGAMKNCHIDTMTVVSFGSGNLYLFGSVDDFATNPQFRFVNNIIENITNSGLDDLVSDFEDPAGYVNNVEDGSWSTSTNSNITRFTSTQMKSLSDFTAQNFDIAQSPDPDSIWVIDDGVSTPTLNLTSSGGGGDPEPEPDPHPGRDVKVKISGLFMSAATKVHVSGSFL